MKLLTHNMLSCHIKGVQNGFPFKIDPVKVQEVDADYDPDFLRHIFPRLEWKALSEAAATMGGPTCRHCFVLGIGSKTTNHKSSALRKVIGILMTVVRLQ